MRRSWNRAACGRRISIGGYTSVPEDGRTCWNYMHEYLLSLHGRRQRAACHYVYIHVPSKHAPVVAASSLVSFNTFIRDAFLEAATISYHRKSFSLDVYAIFLQQRQKILEKVGYTLLAIVQVGVLKRLRMFLFCVYKFLHRRFRRIAKYDFTRSCSAS